MSPAENNMIFSSEFITEQEGEGSRLYSLKVSAENALGGPKNK